MSVIMRSTRFIGSAQYVTKIPKLNSQYSRHIFSQLTDKNANKSMKPCNLQDFKQFQSVAAGEKLAENMMGDSLVPMSAEKSKPNHESLLDKFKFKARFYKFGVRVDYDTPVNYGWCNLQLATQTIDGQPTYKDGIPIHPDIIKSLNEKVNESWFSNFKFTTKFDEYSVKIEIATPWFEARYDERLEFPKSDDKPTHSEDLSIDQYSTTK